MVGRTAYLNIPGSPARPRAPRAFLAYRFDRDRWRRLTAPPLGRDAMLLAAGDRLVAYRGTGRARPHVFDARSRSWSALPPAPLPRSFGHSLGWDGQSLVLFVAAPDSRLGHRPPVARAAAYDFATGEWRRLPDAVDTLMGPIWVRAGSRLISPILGTSDGGEVNGWGADYRNGGILDASAGTWAPLPAEPGGNAFAIGVLTDPARTTSGPPAGCWTPRPTAGCASRATAAAPTAERRWSTRVATCSCSAARASSAAATAFCVATWTWSP